MKLHRAGCTVVWVLGLCLTWNLVSGEARAAQAAWNGSVSGAWNNPANWTPSPPAPSGDFLLFDGAPANVVTNNNIGPLTVTGVAFRAGAAAYTLNGTALTLGWQTTGTGITYEGDVISESANPQTINLPLTLSTKHLITTGAAALNLNGAFTQTKGASVLFTSAGGAINMAGSGLANSNGIIGGWATIGTDLAALDGSSNVVPYAGYTIVDSAANPGAMIADDPASNVRITTQNGTALNVTTPTTRVNTLTFGDGTTALGAAQGIAIGTGNTLVLGPNGGVFNTTGANGNTIRSLNLGTSLAAGGTVTAGDGVNPASITLASVPINVAPQGQGGAVTVNAAITDNGSAPVSVTVRGGYVTLYNSITLPGTGNTYSGGTYILSGRVSQPTQTTFGTGPVYVYPGAMINPGAGGGVTISNNMFIAGNGTTENNGLGAIRMFQNTDGQNTLLTGTITLMADASVGSNGNANPLRYSGLTGKITGPGGLMIGSPTSNANANGSGVVLIGPLAGPGVRADYAGNTTINGTLGGGVGSALRIANADADHILPHGATGNFAGGATGNLVLNATPGRRAVLDLNGSQQTINGLSNTADSAIENVVESELAGGRLYVGDNDASATFDGLIQDGFTLGTVAITKIGAGTQTFKGFHSYTGATRVFNGRLRIDTAYLAASSDVQLSSGAIFDLAFAGINVIDSLYLNGMSMTAGLTYGGAGSGANVITPLIAGTGMLRPSTVGTPLKPGDFDEDGDVDVNDLAKWRRDAFDNPGSDADFDGDSDGHDFLIWQRNLGIPAVPVSGAVPEPAAATLALLGAIAAAGSRRRRN